MPLRRTKRTPVRHARLGTGLRPGERNLRGRIGMRGLMRFHKSSSSTGLAMIVPPCTIRLQAFGMPL
jgi:hypothetical protein